MLTAIVGGHRWPAMIPGLEGTCPVCGGTVVPKLGRIVVHHWAHKTREECDPWAEPDTAWHREWQAEVPAEQREIVLGNHRADIVTPDRTIVELQHSAISVDEIAERETFYGQMLWIFDASEAFTEERLDIRNRDYGVSFRWKHPRKSVATCRRPVLLDLGNGALLLIKKIKTKAPCGGWGRLYTKAQVVALLNGADL